MLVGFGDEGLTRELESPSLKQAPGSDAIVAMKRTEIIDDKLSFAEESLEKIHNLKSTADTKAIVDASVELYEFVIPVYKKEYTQLAKLYDADSNPDQIRDLNQFIHTRYYPRYDALFKRLITNGKAFAARHQIKVNWAN